jgi:hypothetical protein
MHANDLADYLEHDPFLEHSEPQEKVLAQSDEMSEPNLSTPGAPEPPTRSAQTERDKHKSDVLRLVMEIFPGARWTTREAYRRAAATRDRQGRRRRGRVPGER